MINIIDPDIVCLTETHLNGGDSINMKGYIWFGNNCNHINKYAPKPSGGVGIFVKDKLLSYFSINIIDRQTDGLLVIELKHKITEFICVIFVCYLSPENSQWDRDASKFFMYVLTTLYLCSYADLIILCGDFNSRIGKEKDYVDAKTSPLQCCCSNSFKNVLTAVLSHQYGLNQLSHPFQNLA